MTRRKSAAAGSFWVSSIYRDIAALCCNHLLEFIQCSTGENGFPSQFAAVDDIPLASQVEHIGCQLPADGCQFHRAVTLQRLHRLTYFQCVAYRIAQRSIHIGDQSHGTPSHRFADLHHRFGQAHTIFQCFHKGPAAHLYIQYDTVRSSGNLLGHDAGGNQRDALYGGSDITEGIELLVGRSQITPLWPITQAPTVLTVRRNSSGESSTQKPGIDSSLSTVPPV